MFQRVVLEALEVDRRSVYKRRREQLHLAINIFRLAATSSSSPALVFRPLSFPDVLLLVVSFGLFISVFVYDYIYMYIYVIHVYVDVCIHNVYVYLCC